MDDYYFKNPLRRTVLEHYC